MANSQNFFVIIIDSINYWVKYSWQCNKEDKNYCSPARLSRAGEQRRTGMRKDVEWSLLLN